VTSTRQRPIHPTRLLVALALAGSLGLPSCSLLSRGDGRSTERFCSTMKSEQARIRASLEGATDSMEKADDDFTSVLTGLGALGGAAGQLRTYFQKLAAVAPPEIQTETENIAKAIDEQIAQAGNAVSDPLGTFASSLMSGLAISGDLQTVNEFAQENCDLGV